MNIFQKIDMRNVKRAGQFTFCPSLSKEEVKLIKKINALNSLETKFIRARIYNDIKVYEILETQSLLLMDEIMAIASKVEIKIQKTINTCYGIAGYQIPTELRNKFWSKGIYGGSF